METTVLKVSGMTCGGCVKSVTNVLKALPGVNDTQVSLDRGEARVTFDSTVVDLAILRKAIQDAGYQTR